MNNRNSNADPVWEKLYSAGHSQLYPWDIIVSFVYRNIPQDRVRSDIKILEVGCGTASNLWFAAREGFSVAGVDASRSAIDRARERFKNDGLEGDLSVADFTSLPYEDGSFDLIIDRASITCVGLSIASKTIDEIYRVLKNNGRFFFNPYSTAHSSMVTGVKLDDGLVGEMTEGTLVNTGKICFYGERQIRETLKPFKIISLQHVDIHELLDGKKNNHAEWRVILEKTI